MPAHDSARSRRREARRAWRVIKTTLSAQDAVVEPPSAQAALAMMWQLAVDAWSMSGSGVPDYPRARAPVRRLTLAEDGEEARG